MQKNTSAAGTADVIRKAMCFLVRAKNNKDYVCKAYM